MQALIQILNVNEKRSGNKDGRAWELQEAECVLLDENMAPKTVGVLSLPRHMRGDDAPKPGIYTGSFALQSSLRERRIEAVLTGLVPIPTRNAQTSAPKAA